MRTESNRERAVELDFSKEHNNYGRLTFQGKDYGYDRDKVATCCQLDRLVYTVECEADNN